MLLNRFSNIDIFDSTAQAIVNPTNSIGVMGGGLALQFSKKYPVVCNHYDDYCKWAQACFEDKWLMPPLFYKPENWPELNGKIVVMCPSKIHWKDPSQWGYVFKNVTVMFEMARESGIKSLAMPALGTGLGGLDKEVIFRTIANIHKKILANENVLVEYYE